VYLIVRGSAEPYALVPTIRATVRELDPEAPLFEVHSLDDIVDATMSPRRLAATFAIGTAAVSVLLAVIGLYGLLASSVASRTRELGIRRALGSSTAAIVGLVLAEAALLGVVGAAAGAAASLAAARAIQSQLFGVQATDPRVIGAISIVLAVAGMAAAFLPARRAARVDPAVALRHE
jgi:putative ABC transport system permease protein